MSFDLNALLKQAQEMQAQMAQVQEEASQETAEASAGGGMVTVVANAAGEMKELRIDPKVIDPDDPEMLADLVLAAANEALRVCARQGRGEDEERPPAGSRRLAARGLAIDENFVAKLLDVGSELSFPAGPRRGRPDNPMNGVLLVLQGVLDRRVGGRRDERGPGQVIGQWERLDGSDEVRVVAVSDVRLVAVDRAAWETAQTG